MYRDTSEQLAYAASIYICNLSSLMKSLQIFPVEKKNILNIYKNIYFLHREHWFWSISSGSRIQIQNIM